MKKSNTIILTWAFTQDGHDLFVIAHSKPLTRTASEKAWKRFQKEDFVRAVVPQIYLDADLDTPALRAFLKAESQRRYASTFS